MALRIIWTIRAEQGYARIVRYLEENWTEKEVSVFVRETMHFLSLLSENPKMLQESEKSRNLYRGPINRLTMLTYRIKPRKKIIELVNIRSTYQKPLQD
jgi:plasmid stabilization system protein ParE